MTKNKKQQHTIKYVFNEQEIAEKAKQLANECSEKQNLEDEKKAVMSDFKSKVDGKDAIIGLLSNHINFGFEMKTVLCDVEFDFKKGVKHLFFDGKKYDTVKITEEDRQLEIATEEN